MIGTHYIQQDRQEMGKIRRAAAVVLDTPCNLAVAGGCQNQRNGIARVTPGGQIFDIPVVTGDYQERLVHVKTFQYTLQQPIQTLKGLYRFFHTLSMSGVIGLPVFEQGKGELCGKCRKTMARFERSADTDFRVSKGMPSLAGNIRGNALARGKIFRAADWKSGIETRHGCDTQSRFPMLRVIKEPLGERIGKRRPAVRLQDTPEHIVRLDNGTKG